MISLNEKVKHAFFTHLTFWTFIVQGFFVVQVLFALRLGGLVDSDWAMIVFFPHLTLIASLPPKYPLDEKTVHTFMLILKLLEVLSASILYGVIISLARSAIRLLVGRFKAV